MEIKVTIKQAENGRWGATLPDALTLVGWGDTPEIAMGTLITYYSRHFADCDKITITREDYQHP